VGTFLRYLISLGMHIAWQRAGKGGSVPPLRMPAGKNKGKTVPLPNIAPWQIMAALWLAQKIWSIYGHTFKAKLRDHKHPLAGHLYDLIPDPPGTPGGNTNPATITVAPNSSTSRPAPQYHTQPLAGDPATNGSGPLPAGSVLSGLRNAG
jgi:hypothetical protein